MKKLLLALTMAMGMAAVLIGCSKSSDGAEAAEAASAETEAEPSNRLEQILANGKITVATEPYFAPNEFIDSSKSGSEQYVGSDIELAKYIADSLGVELEIVPLEFAAVLSSVTEGKYDLAISALAYTPERAEAMNMSKGYYFDETAGYGLLVREEDIDKYPDAASLADATLVVQSGSLQEVYVNEQVPAYKELKRVSATNDGFLMVQEGKADAAACFITMGQLYCDANPGVVIANDFRFTFDETTQGTRIGMLKGEDELTERINEIIDEVLESGQYEEWFEEYSAYAKELGIE